MKNSILRDKSFEFAVRIVNLRKHMLRESGEKTLSHQVLRSGTSIAANIEEANGAQTKKDFISKLSIAYKECRETTFWLKLLFRTEYITEEQYRSMQTDCDELVKLLTASLLTAKENLDH